MFVMPFSSFWISSGLYPSVVVSEIFLLKRRVRKLKGFRPSAIRVVCVLAYMDSFINVMRGRGCTLSAEKFFEGAVRVFCMLFWELFLFLIVVSFSVMGALLCCLA